MSFDILSLVDLLLIGRPLTIAEPAQPWRYAVKRAKTGPLRGECEPHYPVLIKVEAPDFACCLALRA